LRLYVTYAFTVMSLLSTNYVVQGTSFRFSRDRLYDSEVQHQLAFAQQRNRAVLCSCGLSEGHSLGIRGELPRLHLHRGRNPAELHLESCPHGNASIGYAAERGYSPIAVERAPDGNWAMDFGDLLSGSVQEEMEDQVEDASTGGVGMPAPTQKVRGTVSLLGTLCWLLELSGLHICVQHEQPKTSPWNLLDDAARTMRPRGADGARSLSDSLLLSSLHDESRTAKNSERMTLARASRSGILFACALPFLLRSGQRYELNLGVDLKLSEAVVSRALRLRRNNFAGSRAVGGNPTLILGRAYFCNGVAIVDRIALMPIYALGCHAPVQSAREFKRCEKVFDKKGRFEAKLSFDS